MPLTVTLHLDPIGVLPYCLLLSLPPDVPPLVSCRSCLCDPHESDNHATSNSFRCLLLVELVAWRWVRNAWR
jgi:hypothetical protein